MTRRHPLPPERRQPHEEAHARSARVKGDRIGHKPATLSGLLRWLQAGYALEAPNRLHDRDTADDGTPDHTGEAKAYLGLSQQREPNDWPAVARRLDPDGFYQTPMRAALSRVGDPDRRRLLGGLAVNMFTPLDVTRAQDVPDWAAGDVMFRSLQMLWSVYTERPIPQRGWVDKSDSQRAAEEAA